ncbi:hypothetical protein GCM10023310_39130 [Paenibacillus vulneris]
MEEPYPDMHPGGPREGWEKQFKKKHWEFNYTNDVSLGLPEPIMVTEADETKWKQSYVYGAGGERISMTYLPAYDANNGWEPTPGAGGAEPGVAPRTLFYLNDALGSTIGLIEKDGRARLVIITTSSVFRSMPRNSIRTGRDRTTCTAIQA